MTRLSDDDVRAALADPTTEWRTEERLRDSAVLIVLVQRDGVDHLVFTLRRDDLASHAGQVSFPGGGREGDEDAVTCALRETQEELGIEPATVEVLGRLPERVSIAGYLVTPYVARWREPHDVVPDPSEVADVFEVPLPHLVERTRWRFRTLDTPRGRFRHIPYFDSDHHVVWGLTGIIVGDFLRATLDLDLTP